MNSIPSTNIKLLLLNAENLFLLFDQEPTKKVTEMTEDEWKKLSHSIYETKSLNKCLGLAKAIRAQDPNIIMLCEVGGLDSLTQFNKYFLGEEYMPALIEGNSDRNIDVGFLIRKNQNYYFELNTNKNRPINFLYAHEKTSLENGYPVAKSPSHKFSRDVAELRLFVSDREKPFLVILLTHLKSRLDHDNIDPQGFERRQAEARTLVEIYEEAVQQWPGCPFIVAGDFNGNAAKLNTDEEFKIIYEKTDLEDVLEVAQLKADDRATYYNVRSGGRTEGRQIDYAFISNNLQPYLGLTSVHRYVDEFGSPYAIPQSIDAKLKLPSDHYPLFFELRDLPTRPSSK